MSFKTKNLAHQFTKPKVLTKRALFMPVNNLTKVTPAQLTLNYLIPLMTIVLLGIITTDNAMPMI
jgi:hypothetical protein